MSPASFPARTTAAECKGVLDICDQAKACLQAPLICRTCPQCRRPKRTCLCPALPARLVDTRGRVIVLQHPAEHKRRLATVPLLQACLRQCTVLRGRRFKAGQHAELDAALEAAASAATPVYVLFPGAGAASVSEVACASKHRRCLKQAPLPVLDTHPGPHALEGDATPGGAPNAVAPGALSLPGPAHAAESPPARGSHPAYWLIALDGTWQQANEMFQAAARGLLARATRVELPHEHSAAAAPLVHGQAAVGAQPGGERGERPCTEPGIHAPIRVEPARGCVTTLEAIARALAVLEGDAGLEEVLLAPLRRMTEIQAQFDPAVRERLAGGTCNRSSRRCIGFLHS